MPGFNLEKLKYLAHDDPKRKSHWDVSVWSCDDDDLNFKIRNKLFSAISNLESEVLGVVGGGGVWNSVTLFLTI